MSATPDLYAIVDAEIERQDARVKIPPQRQTVVVERLKRGVTVETCSRSEGAPRAHVIAVGFAAGLVHDTARDVMIPRAAPAIATAQPQTTTAQSLIARAGERTDAKTARLVKRLQDVTVELTAHLDELEAREARDRQAERERARLQSEEAKLAARLAEIRAELRGNTPPVKRRAAAPDASTQAKQRAAAYYTRVNQLGGREAIARWAAANGIPVPTHNLGRFSKQVLDSFEAQLGTTPEGDNQ